jgi:hypothetical protein
MRTSDLAGRLPLHPPRSGTSPCVIALVVGMSQVSHAVNQELRDVAAAYSNMNQSYQAGQNGQYDDGMDHTPGEIWAAGSEAESGG